LVRNTNYLKQKIDLTGYIDKDAEKWYANWKISDKNKAIAQDTISNVDIYDGLYDL
jgi:hypothetical protein